MDSADEKKSGSFWILRERGYIHVAHMRGDAQLVSKTIKQKKQALYARNDNCMCDRRI